MQLVQQLYVQDSRPWIIAYSGGKDSTAVLQLVWLAIQALKPPQRTKSIEIAYVDTGMEHPAYSHLLWETFESITRASDLSQMPFKVRLLRPELRHRYFVAVIGRGYAPPTHWFRWCTKDMRIRPMTQFIRSHTSVKEQAVILMGLRRSESQARKITLAKYATGKAFQSTYKSYSRLTAFTPIEDFATEEVWQFLMQTPCPWGDGNRSLARLYSLASNGECASQSVGDGIGRTCGGSRFGCWTCTVVRRDRTGESLADEDERYEWLLGFRNWLSIIRYDRKRRWNTRRNGSPGPGPLRLSTRREILRKLAAIHFESGFSLISEEELLEIQRLWNLDGDRKQSAIGIWHEFRLASSELRQNDLINIQPTVLKK